MDEGIEIIKPKVLNNPKPMRSMGYTCYDNTVYLFGGRTDDEYFDDMYQLKLDNIKQLKWNKIEKQNMWPQKRCSMTLDCYNNGLYLIGGGTDQITYGDIWEYNITEENWKKVKNILIRYGKFR